MCLPDLVAWRSLYERTGLDPRSRAHLVDCERQAAAILIPLGIWGDGVPCNWDRTESVETLSANLPGRTGDAKSLRMPITGINHKQMAEDTWDDIMDVVAWSLKYCAVGTLPTERHDGSAWLSHDCHRRKRAAKNSNMAGRAALVEVRGDWKMFGETFRLLKHTENAGICWSCTCTPREVWYTYPMLSGCKHAITSPRKEFLGRRGCMHACADHEDK